jgi:hypothetical protein
VRILARVLGNDLSSLLDKITAATSASGNMGEAEFAASLLASLSLDADVASKLIRAGHMANIMQASCGVAASRLKLTVSCAAIRSE